MRHDALELPSGSFELSDLERIGDQAAAAQTEEDRAKILRDGLAAANKRIDEAAVPGMLPDHVVKPVNRILQEGVQRELADGSTETVGRVVVQEQVMVYDPKAAAEQDPAAQDAAVASADAVADASAPPAESADAAAPPAA